MSAQQPAGAQGAAPPALDDEQVEQLAAELDEAARTRVPLEQFSRRHPAMTIADGYRIQRAWVARQCARGRRIVGHKIGLTSRAMQQASRIDEPDYGALLDDMLLEPGPIERARFVAPRVEVELAFVLARRLEGPGLSVDAVLDATAYVQPAVEIIDARIEQVCRHSGRMRRVQDTISDNAANAGVVPGGRQADPRALDLPWCGAILRKNGSVEETGLAAGVQGHPAIGIAWLAARLAAWGEALEPGEIVLAGSFTRPVAAAAGDRFDADYGPLGRFTFDFV